MPGWRWRNHRKLHDRHLSNGFGSVPFGTGPYGFGTPDPGDEWTGSPTVDPTTNRSTGIRLMRNGDYVRSAGRPLGMTRAQQMVLLAVSTNKGTSAVKALGNKLKTLERVTENFASLCESTMRDALAQAEALGVIQIRTITTVKEPQKPAYIRVEWFDVEAQTLRTERIE